MKKRLAVGASGGGTTFEAILSAVEKGDLDMEIACLFCDRVCGAEERAKKHGIRIVERKKDEDISSFHTRVTEELRKERVDVVALAGYLRLFPVKEEDSYLVLNSHPAAIPYFGGEGMWGLYVHEAVLKWARDTNFKYPYTFSTVHIASSEYDKGPVLGIEKCRIEESDTKETLAERLLPLEHKNYVNVLKKVSKDDLGTVEYSEGFYALM